MAASDALEVSARLAARRAYERGRAQGAVRRGAFAAALAAPGFFACGQSSWAAACLVGFVLVVIASRVRGGAFDSGARAGTVAGILPCLLPAALRAFDPELCLRLSANGLWICVFGGVAAGVLLGLRARRGTGAAFWATALATTGLAGSIGCLPAGAMGFAGLAAGLIAGGAPVFAARKAAA